jgi:ABC-type glycerol-3-phosphate transport system substrate-binding protein
MGLGVGIFLLAVGAVLAFAIHVTTNGAINVQVVGWILMGAGALGIVLSMVFWSSWGGPSSLTRRREVVDPTGASHTTTIDQR